MIARETLASGRLEVLAVAAIVTLVVLLGTVLRRRSPALRIAIAVFGTAVVGVLAAGAWGLREPGWSAAYHEQRGLAGPPIRLAVEPNFNMAAVRDRTIEVSQRRFSVRWSGWMPTLTRQQTRLRALHFGSVEVFLDGERILSGRPGEPFERRLADRRDLRTVPVDLAAGWHHWEIRYEPAGSSDYALALDLAPDSDSDEGMRFADALVLPHPPGALLALGVGPIFGAAGGTIATVLAGLATFLGMLLFRPDHPWLREARSTIARIDGSLPVRIVATPARGLLRAIASLRSRWASPWLAFAFTLILAAPLLFGQLDDRPMNGDEVIHGLAAAQADLDGLWYPLHFQGKPYFQKPPLKIWTEAWLFRLFGVGSFQARVLDALAALATVSMLFGLALRSKVLGRSSDPVLGMLAATIFVMSPAILSTHGSREGVQDATLVLATFAAGVLALGSLRARHGGQRRASRRWALGAGAALAVGYGVKIFVAFVPALGYIAFELVDAFLSWCRSQPVRLAGRARSLGWMAAVPLVAVLGWTAVNLAIVGDDYLAMLHGTLFGRAQGEMGHLQPPGYYVHQIVQPRGALGPWGTLLPVALLYAAVRVVKRGDDGDISARGTLGVAAFATVWTVFVFSLSRAKNPWYVYPAYPWMALLVATLTLRIFRGMAGSARLPHLGALGAASVVVAASYAIGTTLPRAAQWWDVPPQRSTAQVADSAVRLAGEPISIYVLAEHDLPVLGGPFVRHEGTTYRRRMEWLGNVLRSRGPVEIVPADFTPPADGRPFVVLIRSKEPLPADAPWLDAIESAAHFDPELTLLASGFVGEDFLPFPIVERGRALGEIAACGNLRVDARDARVLRANEASCGLEIGPWTRIRLLGRTEGPVQVDFLFDEDAPPWTGSIAAMADGHFIGETLDGGSTISMTLPAGSFDHRDVEFGFWNSGGDWARLEGLRIQIEAP